MSVFREKDSKGCLACRSKMNLSTSDESDLHRDVVEAIKKATVNVLQ